MSRVITLFEQRDDPYQKPELKPDDPTPSGLEKPHRVAGIRSIF